MNRKLYAGILVLTGLTLSFLTSCSSSSHNTPPPPAVTIAATSGGGQSATVGTAFTNALVATVTTGGSPTANVVVTFTAPGSGATGTFAGGANTATTNSSGVATSAAFTAGTVAGAYNVTASTTGATTNASFGLTNTAGPAATVTATGGTPQSVPVSTAFAALQATVVDSDQNPVGSGIVVTFTAPGSGASGTFADSGNNVTTATTNASGVATPAVFTANATVGGPYNVVASSGALTPVNFSLTNTAAVPVIAVTSGSGQSATVSTAFAAPLVATVTTAGVPSPGLVVTFTPPSSGASGTFAGGVNTATTDVNGVATSTVFTANATAGGYTVAATVTGGTAPANFTLTNTAVTSGSNTYVFYLSGLEAINNSLGPNFYAVVGAVTIDSSGNVTAGEQDYNDAFGLTSPGEPNTPDTITSGTLTVSSTTGQGTLMLNMAAGSAVTTETLGVQFVNTNHALISEFDGNATSSGSLDLQVLGGVTGSFAFTFSGVDSNYAPVGSGGVFTVGNTNTTGTIDVNDSGTVITGTPFTLTSGNPDGFKRNVSTGLTNPVTLVPVTLVTYNVGPEVLRIIDVDAASSAVGSAYGQGAGSFTDASLPSSVFGLASSEFGFLYDAVGIFATTPGTGTFTGVADDNEGGTFVVASTISGTYSVPSSGYGSLTITNAGLGSVSALGIYMTDPALNLNDPNNPSGGGGALVLDLDAALPSGTGVLVPQTDTSTAAFTNAYVFGAQQFNGDAFWEMDFVGQGTVTAGTLAGTGLVSDPGGFFSATVADSGVGFSGTPLADAAHAGRYSMSSTNVPSNQLVLTVGGTQFGSNVVLYQASGGQLFWIEEDIFAGFLGPLEQQGSLSGLPLARKPAEKTQTKHKH